MTAAPGDEEAHTDSVQQITDRLDEYLDVLAEEKEEVEEMLDELDQYPDDVGLTRQEYHDLFPTDMPLEEWGGFGG